MNGADHQDGPDADDDDLSFVVQYPTDGGTTYETLAADHWLMSLSVPRRLLAGSATARVRVVASDGVRPAAVGTAVIDTGDLTAGTHTHTATANDSDNTTAAASATVTVTAGKAANDAPTAHDDTAHSRVGRTQAVAVLANDTDPEDDMDPWSVRVVAPAALGAAAADSPAPGAVAYEAAAAGIDVIIYEVCDRFLQCSSAELVVAVLEDR